MTAQQTASVQNPQLVQDNEKKHLNEIASHLSQATNSQVKLQDIQPAIDQHPLPQFAPQAAVASPQVSTEEEKPNQDSLNLLSPDSDLSDFMEGMQGRPRHAPAMDFLKDKLSMMKKKYGEVKLIKK